MKWITRERPKIDRVACPWLIKRFIDADAEIIYAPFEKITTLAQQLQAIPFDVPDVEHTHYGDNCTFDYFIQRYNITDPALHIMAPIVRGADTDRHDLAAQSAGLWAIASGMSFNIKSDDELLKQGMLIYDSLYTWAKYLQNEKHIQQPFENLLLVAITSFIKKNSAPGSKVPAWAQALKELIQDHIDSSITLKEISKNLDMNPSHLSREFSKYFDNLSFGEYIRKERIRKAIQLMKTPGYSLTQIAYLTGFSDQSHFNRIFRQETGETPSAYRKKLPEK